MSLMDSNFDDVKDLESVSPGEYKLSILELEEGVGKTSQKPYLRVRFSITDVDNAKQINHFLSIPTEYDEPSVQQSKMRRMKAFFQAFSFDTAGMSLKDAISERSLERLKGREGWAILEEEEDAQYGTQNTIKRFM